MSSIESIADSRVNRRELFRRGAIAAVVFAATGPLLSGCDNKDTPKTPEIVPTLTPLEKEMTNTWNMFSQLRADEYIDYKLALPLLPAALKLNDVTPVISAFRSLSKKIDDNAAAVLVPTILSKGVPEEQVIEELRSIHNHFDKDAEAAAFVTIAINNQTTAKDVYTRYQELNKALNSENGSKMLTPLLYLGYSIDQITNTWEGMRKVTEKEEYDRDPGVDEILTSAQILTDEQAKDIFNIYQSIKEHVDEGNDVNAAELTVATVANGHNQEQIEQMFNYFVKQIDNSLDGQEGISAALTTQTVLKNPQLPKFIQLQNSSDSDIIDWYLNPASPLSPLNPLSPFSPLNYPSD